MVSQTGLKPKNLFYTSRAIELPKVPILDIFESLTPVGVYIWVKNKVLYTKQVYCKLYSLFT